MTEKAANYNLDLILSVRTNFLAVHSGFNTFKPVVDNGYKVKPLMNKSVDVIDDGKQFEVNLNRLLNKITKENYEKIIEDVCLMNFDNENKIQTLASNIIRNALNQSNFISIYARSCGRLSFINFNNKTFVAILIEQIREIFLTSVRLDKNTAENMDENEEDSIKNRRINVCKLIAELSFILDIDEILIKCTNIIFSVVNKWNEDKFIFARDAIMGCLIEIINILVSKPIKNNNIMEQINKAKEMGKQCTSKRLSVMMELAIDKIKK